MGRILLVENDPVFGAVLEDRLHVAGHRVELLSDRRRMVDAARKKGADLVICAMDRASGDGLATIRQLKEQSETRSLPILVLSENAESAERVEALRAGVDEYLTKPCNLDELMIRVERLVGHQASHAVVLHGDLSNHPLWELVQYLRQAGKSGDLVIRGRSRGGRIRVRGGRIAAAECGHLPGSEALLALLGLKEGRFRFVSETDATAIDAERELSSVHEVLLEAAHLEDELEKRRAHLPATGAPLQAANREVPSPGKNEQFAKLPLAEIDARIRRDPGLRLHDLMAHLPLAPQKIRLAVAWLVEKGVVLPPSAAPAVAYPTTTEISSSLLLDMAVTEFLTAARQAGFSTSALPFLVLAEPSVWSVLLDLVENVPGYQGNESLKAFSEQLRLRRGGSVGFATETGKLSLHAQVLKAGAKAQIDAVVSACAGVLVWLDDGGEEELVRGVVERLEKARGAATGMLVATGELSRRLAEQLVRGSSRWRVSSHAPKSLLGVLRLMQPGRSS